MKVLVIKWIVAVLVLFSTATVYAEKSETTEAAEAAPRFEVETYLKMGGLGFYENGHSEGHKFFVGGELKVGSPLRPGTQFFLSVSGWRLGEALDEDKEMPLQGGRIGGEFRHNFMIKDLLISHYLTWKSLTNQHSWLPRQQSLRRRARSPRRVMHRAQTEAQLLRNLTCFDRTVHS